MVLFWLKFTNLSHIFPQKVKGMGCSQFYVSFSVKTELKCGGGSALTGAKSHTNKANMLLRSAPGRPHDARSGKAIICTSLLPDSFRHLGSCFNTYRTELGKSTTNFQPHGRTFPIQTCSPILSCRIWLGQAMQAMPSTLTPKSLLSGVRFTRSRP